MLPWSEEDERRLALHATVLGLGLENLCLIARNRRARFVTGLFLYLMCVDVCVRVRWEQTKTCFRQYA